MGCYQSTAQDNWREIKSIPLKQFFQSCKTLNITEVYACKKTTYEYRYVRGLREWIMLYDKQIFIEEYPVLVNPCSGETFQQVLAGVAKYKTKTLDSEEEVSQLKGFPKNIGMLLNKGQKFPSFLTAILRQTSFVPFECQLGKTYVFIHWRLHKRQTIDRSRKVQLVSSRQHGLFYEPPLTNYYETAFDRAQKYLSIPNVYLIGVCMDKPELREEYENYVKNDTQDHIWIEQQLSMYSVDYHDTNPYENQAFQAFRFARNDPDSPIRSLENSVYLVDQSGVFQGVYQENFCDETFVQLIKSLIKSQVDLSTRDMERSSGRTPIMEDSSTYDHDVLERIRKHNNQINRLESQTRDEFRKIKKLITTTIPNKVKSGSGSGWLQLGDTFSLQAEKYTYYSACRKTRVVYPKPKLQFAASTKYVVYYDELKSQLRNDIPSFISVDYRRRETIDKKAFFKMMNLKMSEFGWNDIRFILERQQTLYYDQDIKRFVLDRKLDQLHNAPLSINAVFTRRDKLRSLKDWLFANQNKLAPSVTKLIKEFLSNIYGFSYKIKQYNSTAFHVGMKYCPIPNVYKISHSNPISNHVNPLEIKVNREYASLEPNSTKSQKRSFQIFESIELNKKSEIHINDQDVQSLSLDWEGHEDREEEQAVLDNTLKQVGKEILIIWQLDFSKANHTTQLQELLRHIRSKGWSKDMIRVATIGVQDSDSQFERCLTKYQLDKDMSRGIYEPWFSIEKCYLGFHFKQMLVDLYGLDRNGTIVIVDSHGKLAYRGLWDNQIQTQLDNIVNGSNSDTIYSFDHLLRNRQKAAQYEREWNKIKAYGYYDIKRSTFARDIETFLQKHPLLKSEFWKLEIRSFQLWDQRGNLVGKFYERPRLGYKFERPYLQAKFEHLNSEIFIKLNKEEIKYIDVTDFSKDDPSVQPLGTIQNHLKQSLYTL